MGNLNSTDFGSRRSDANFMLFLVQKWNSEINGEDSKSGSFGRKYWDSLSKFKASHTIGRMQGNKLKRNGSVGKTGWKSRKNFILRSGTQSVKSYQSYAKQKEMEFLNENPVFDWETKSVEELRKVKQDMRSKEIRAMDACRSSGKEKMRRHMRKRKKKLKERNLDCDSEMWTLTEKNQEFDQISLKSSRSLATSLNSEDPGPERIFWKTSKLSLTESGVVSDVERSSNMLWRSSKHIQSMDGTESVFDLQTGRHSESGTLKLSGRKKRFSRWTFLRYEPKSEDRGSPNIRVRTLPKYEAAACSRGRKTRRKWRLFKDAGEGKSEAEAEESCDCSCCSCNGCQQKDGFEITFDSISLDLSESEMAPNSEEDTRIIYQNGKAWRNEESEKEPQRPPVYNPEDYAQCLKKWGRKGSLGMQLPLYVSQSTGSIEKISEMAKPMQNKRQSSPSTKSSNSSRNGDEKPCKKEKEMTLKTEKEPRNLENLMGGSKNGVGKDLKNPIVTMAPQEVEMSLRQFSSVTELLGKLKSDLRLAFPSFVQEFVGDPVDGVTLLLELLRAVQLSQATQQQRCPPQVLRRALLDEHSCLICLKHCLRCPDASRRLASSSAGLFTLAVCIMSNVTKSRIIALELLTKACEPPANGHKPVSEALSTLRLRFGEPVRFRFLVGMLNSAGAVELLTAAMKFINSFMSTAPNVQQKVYIQAELEQAGFDSKILRKTLPNHSESVKAELNKWDKNYFDIETLEMKVAEMDSLRDKVQLLEKRVQILQEEKGILQSLEQCLKERCSELEEEVSIKTSTTTLTKSTAHIKPFRNYTTQQSHYISKRNNDKAESTPAEDEGISSSEQELSQDEDCAKGAIPYNITTNCESVIRNVKEKKPFEGKDQKPSTTKEKMITRNARNSKMKESNVDDGNEVNGSGQEEDEEETTIDEVIEELRNIVNDAETEVYGPEKQKGVDLVSASPKSYMRRQELVGKPLMTRPDCDGNVFEEAEIVPSGLLPQPPRRTRSLVHIFLPGTEYDDNGKNEFFDDETETESSDSLLTAAREKRSNHKNCHHRSLDVSDSYNSSSSINTRTLFIKQQNDYEDSEVNVKMSYEHTPEDEALKRKHYKEKTSGKDDSKAHPEAMHQYEKTTSFQGVKTWRTGEVVDEPYLRRPGKFVPVPVKRSQTFHIMTPEGNRSPKRTEIKPKPKMGVSGLDLQRNVELKMKAESFKCQNFDFRKNCDRNNADRYTKKMTKESERQTQHEKTPFPLQRRGSLDGLFFVTEVENERRLSGADSQSGNQAKPEEKRNLRSMSLEKMDDGLDSLVDIVFSPDQTKSPKKPEWNADKNIGPRTRRSLAESSLFHQPYLNNLNKEARSPQPPQPAQRTSITRNSSSSIPLHMPVEIKITPMRQQPPKNYNFNLKSAKSESNLTSPPKRYPPDGSSSPNEFSTNQGSEVLNLKNSKPEESAYAVPLKQSRLQKFFGNPKFENSVGGNGNTAQNQKYFESNYACSPMITASATTPKSVSPMPRNITAQKVKNVKPPEGTQPKLNFFLGTYNQSHPPGKTYSSESPSPTSGNPFNNGFLIRRGHANAGMYSGSNNQPCRSQLDANPGSGRQSIMSTYSSGTNSTKVTDSLSGLY